MPRVTSKSAAVGGTVALAAVGLVLFAGLRNEGGAEPVIGGEDAFGTVVADGALGPAFEAQVCLTDGIAAETISDLNAQIQTEASNLGGDAGEAKNSLPIERDQAASVLGFAALFPDAPPGWTSTTRILDHNPQTPLTGSCELETVVLDPTVTEKRVLTVNDEGQPVEHEGVDYTIEKFARVSVQAGSSLDDAEAGDGFVTTSVEINGRPAVLSTRDSDEPSVFVSWIDGDVRVDVSCSLMSVEECVGIAETVK